VVFGDVLFFSEDQDQVGYGDVNFAVAVVFYGVQ